MFEIDGDGQFIDVQSNSVYDSNMNNYAGGQKLVVEVKAGWELTQMKTDLDLLRTEMQSLRNERQQEAILRKSNPALQDMYEKYQIVLGLVKDAAEKAKGDDVS